MSVNTDFANQLLPAAFAGSWDDVYAALAEGRCAVISNPHCSYSAGNSVVLCGPQLVPQEIIPAGQHFMAISTVFITGVSHEPLHTHTSHVITWMIEGTGWLTLADGRLEATAGDLVVVPREVPHSFNGPIGSRIVFVGLELSDQALDYQKNFYKK
jgi:quercetin dioxygenase-like cupin family protein